jgi:transcriptional regulator with XRE-family HTH domain
MRKEQRPLALRELDTRQRWFRVAGEQNRFRMVWLRDVRHALGIPVAELARKLKMNPSVIFRLEERERKKGVTLRTLERMAEAMDCKLVYAIVPRRGTLEQMGQDREWEKRRRSREQGTGISYQ